VVRGVAIPTENHLAKNCHVENQNSEKEVHTAEEKIHYLMLEIVSSKENNIRKPGCRINTKGESETH